MTDYYDILERTNLTQTENTTGLYWHQKGLATFVSLPYHLFRLQSIHHRFHSYAQHHNLVSGVNNRISGRPSRYMNFIDTNLLEYMSLTYSQRLPWRLWIPPNTLAYTIASTLRLITLPMAFLLSKTPLPMGTEQSGTRSYRTWPLNL